mmetsp:Transcript_74804/g.200523  ORF Transcript_74804/g.200523 Transcript_74804/m.200523 type:complete len:323 (+) Transcript_74804:553-1521(+)
MRSKGFRGGRTGARRRGYHDGGLEHVKRVDQRGAVEDGHAAALAVRLLQQAHVPRYLLNRLLEIIQLLPNLLAHGVDLLGRGREQHVLVVARNAPARLSKDHLQKLHSGTEEGPLPVHALEFVDVSGCNMLLDRRAHAQPNRQLQTRLGPREDPGDGPKCLNAPNAPLARARANVEGLELLLGRNGAEQVDEGRGVEDNAAIHLAAPLRQRLHESARLLRRRLRRRQRGAQNRHRVPLHGVRGDGGQAEEAVNHLPLHRDAHPALHRSRGLRQRRQILRPAAPAYGAAAAMEQVELDAVPHGQLDKRLLPAFSRTILLLLQV